MDMVVLADRIRSGALANGSQVEDMQLFEIGLQCMPSFRHLLCESSKCLDPLVPSLNRAVIQLHRDSHSTTTLEVQT